MNSRFLKQSLVAASLITVGANFLSRFFGYVREAVIADYFGTSAVFDTFILAFTIPELLTFITFAALPTAIIPVLAGHKATSSSEAALHAVESRLFRKGLVVFTVVFGVLSVLIFLLRGQLLDWLAPELATDQRELGVYLMALLALFVLFRGIEAYFRGWLYEKKHFISPALSPFLINAVVLFVLLLFYGRLNIAALAYGWLAGSALSLVYNGLFVFRVVRPTAAVPSVSVSVKPLLSLTFTIALLETIALVYPVIDRFLAAKYLGEGQIAALRYAIFLGQLAPGVLVATFSLASFPWIADLSAPAERERLTRLYSDSVRLIFFVMALVATGLSLFASDIVRVAFQRGAFDQTSLELTTGAFRYYAAGIFFYSILIYQMRIYYARKATGRLGVILLLMLLVKVVASLVLVGPMEHEGLALATGIAWLVGFVVLTLDVSHILKLSTAALFAPGVTRVIPIVALVAASWYALAQLWPVSSGDSLLYCFARLAIIGGAGTVVYLLLALWVKLPEPKRVVRTVTARFRSFRSNGR